MVKIKPKIILRSISDRSDDGFGLGESMGEGEGIEVEVGIVSKPKHPLIQRITIGMSFLNLENDRIVLVPILQLNYINETIPFW